MDQSAVDKFKAKLLKLKMEILNGGIINSKADLHVSQDDLADETDLASNVIAQQISFSIREREIRKLRLIEQALQRVEEGGFGECEDCGEDIEHKRLENQPWTTLCIVHAEERERELMRTQRRA